MEAVIIPNGSLAEVACYKEQVIKDYRNNPLIEALPPLQSPDTIIGKLAYYPEYDPNERNLESYYRIHIINRLFEVFQPLPMTVELDSRISRILRQGYISRNPFGPQLASGFREGYGLLHNPNMPINGVSNQSAYGFTLIGTSGLGKTTALNRILAMYPQVIAHSEYKGIPFSAYQVVWIKLETPHDASIKGLLFEFFSITDRLLGTNYYRKMASTRPTTDIMLSAMNQVVRNINCGVIIIDEIQHLSAAKSGGSEKMLSFFTNLVNSVGVPIILVGTPKAIGIVQAEFRQARRGSSGLGGDMICDRMENDRAWELLVRTLWHYQWTKKDTPLTQELIDVLYDETQGIPDLLKKVYGIAQAQAIATGKEKITPALIKKVAKENLKLVQPMIAALKTGDVRKIAKYQDIYIPDVDLESFVIKTRQPVILDYEPKAAPTPLPPEKKKEEEKIKNEKSKEIVKEDPLDIRVIVERGKAQDMSAYEALLTAGYIKTFENDIFSVG